MCRVILYHYADLPACIPNIYFIHLVNTSGAPMTIFAQVSQDYEQQYLNVKFMYCDGKKAFQMLEYLF